MSCATYVDTAKRGDCPALMSLLFDTFSRSDSYYPNQPKKLKKNLTVAVQEVSVLGAAILEKDSRHGKGMCDSGFMGGTDQVIVTTKVASSDLEKMSKKCLYLHWMAVAHAKQGEGHGTTIMSDCLDRKLPGQSLILTTAGKDSCRFYHKSGLIHIATHTDASGKTRWDVFGSPADDLEVDSSAVCAFADCPECSSWA